MSPNLSARPSSRLPGWQVCLCVFLIALVVYNPFAALNGSPSGCLSYEQHARNRSSIGAGELQHFSPVSDPEVPINTDVELRGTEPVRCVQENWPGPDQLKVIPSEPALLTGVWFRPPPSL
jgi:hypothetical protein